MWDICGFCRWRFLEVPKRKSRFSEDPFVISCQLLVFIPVGSWSLPSGPLDQLGNFSLLYCFYPGETRTRQTSPQPTRLEPLVCAYSNTEKLFVCVCVCQAASFPRSSSTPYSHTRIEQAPPGQIFKVKTGWAHKKLRGGGHVATSVRVEGGRDERRAMGEKRGWSSCRNESGHCWRQHLSILQTRG